MSLFIVIFHLVMLGLFAANLRYLRLRSSARGRLREDTSYPFVSVVIPARNEATNLRRLLPSLFRQAYPHFEVIVYDDGSDDGTSDVLRELAEPRLTALRGEGPPPGWIGKVHALFQATRGAAGEVYLFLDADAELLDPGALGRLVDHHEAMPQPGVLTVLPQYRGGGLLLVSVLPYAILAGLPWPLVRRLPSRNLGALNGQCWMISAALYRQYEPHRTVAREVLEDVMIGRYLKSAGVIPTLVDARDAIAIYMYGSLGEAWAGFRKNAYLLLGGKITPFVPLFLFFLMVYTLAPLFGWGPLAMVYLGKLLSDRKSGMPIWVSLFAPLSYAIASIVQVDSALAHLRGNVTWKGRTV